MQRRVTPVECITHSVPLERGLWCDRCLLPSVIRYRLHAVTLATSFDCGVFLVCHDCETITRGG